MLSINPCPVPEASLLSGYIRSGAYADCYVTDIDKPVSHAQYVEAFYTTAVFRIERQILQWAVSKPSTDAQAKRLASGTIDSFAAWHVESRSENQLLLCDFSARTRSWLMIAPFRSDGGAITRLYFGSAVVPVKHPETGEASLGLGFHSLLGFHKLYSKILLYAAKSRLERQNL